MAALTGATVSMNVRRKTVDDHYFELDGSFVFGDGASTYPSGGIPVTLGQIGFRNVLSSIHWTDESSSDGYVYKFDVATLSIRIYQTGTAANDPLNEVTTAYVPALATNLTFTAKGH